jgi:hypothetical protein
MAWEGFAEMIGSASGALTGLLFVAVSLNANRIAHHDGLRASAAQTLVLFISPLVMAGFLLTPGQPHWVIGSEFIVAGLIASVALVSAGQIIRGLSDDDLKLISIFDRRAASVLVMLLFVISGIILVCGSDDGLYLLLPATLIALVSGVLNAWHFLLPPPAASDRLSEARRSVDGKDVSAAGLPDGHAGGDVK